MQRQLFHVVLLFSHSLGMALNIPTSSSPFPGSLNISNNETGTPVNPSSLDVGLEHPTLNFPEPPDSFGMRVIYGSNDLGPSSCMRNAINALEKLALQPWESLVTAEEAYHLSLEPVCLFELVPAPGKADFPRRLAVWGIFYGVYQMYATGKWKNAFFALIWYGVYLGQVRVLMQGPPRPEPAQTIGSGTPHDNKASAYEKRSNGDLLVTNSNSTTGIVLLNDTQTLDVTDEERLRVDFEYSEPIVFIPYASVFFPVMASLVDLARFPSPSDETDPYVTPSSPERFVGYLTIVPYGRTIQPVLEYRWMIIAISRIVSWMNDQRRFAAIDMDIFVDGYKVAIGTFKTRRE